MRVLPPTEVTDHEIVEFELYNPVLRKSPHLWRHPNTGIGSTGLLATVGGFNIRAKALFIV